MNWRKMTLVLVVFTVLAGYMAARNAARNGRAEQP